MKAWAQKFWKERDEKKQKEGESGGKREPLRLSTEGKPSTLAGTKSGESPDATAANSKINYTVHEISKEQLIKMHEQLIEYSKKEIERLKKKEKVRATNYKVKA